MYKLRIYFCKIFLANFADGPLQTESCNLFTTSIKNLAEKAIYCIMHGICKKKVRPKIPLDKINRILYESCDWII